jgi:hypothetical protein
MCELGSKWKSSGFEHTGFFQLQAAKLSSELAFSSK